MSKWRKLSFIFFSMFLALASWRCASKPAQNSLAEEKTNLPNLTLTDAEKRFNQVKDVTYKLRFEFDAKEEAYNGTVVIAFKAMDIKSPLRIDFYDGTVTSVEANGTSVGYQYNGQFINLPGDILNDGVNKVFIKFSSKLKKQGHGISRFEDPEDKNVYIHTHLEPYYANYVFPCFDQPDIKATYESEVRAPRTWNVISSTREEKITESGDHRIWKFPESARFSTYIWSLHAGPFKIWEKNFRIPLRLFVRQSLAKYVKTEEWFEPTKQGFDFYETYFDYKYPYKKYDQLILPEFSSGAMENVAAVTFNERFVSRGQKTIREKRNLANVILHEMAHMWFGDLVTMKWWNDLWLNESFATYMASLSMFSNTKYKEAWRDFYGSKGGAYWEDDLVTTHPIEGDVPDTLQAMANFDGITYGKGASALKQLSFFLTPEKFQKGVQLYFKKYANSNTRREDFMGSLSEGSGRDLNSWQKIWLKTAGVNRIETQFSCTSGKIDKFELLQKASPDYDYLRPHRALIALLYREGDQLNVGKTQAVEISGKTTMVKELIGENCPSIAYPNYEDHGYFITEVDPISLENFKMNPSSVRSPFLRQMLWKSMWDLTREAKLPLKDYVTMLTEQGLKKEKDDFILKDLTRAVYGFGSNSASVLFYLSRGSKENFTKMARQIEEILWTRLTAAPGNSEEQKILLNGFIYSTRTEFAQQKLLGLLKGQYQLKSLPIDQDRRWDIIEALAQAENPQAKTLIATEEKKDKSYFGAQGALSSKTALAAWPEKQKWIEEFKKEKSSLSNHQFWAVTENIFPWTQEVFREKYSTQFFDDLTYVNKSKESTIASVFTWLAPIDCGSGKDRIGSYLDKHDGELQPQVLKNLKITRQENQRCQKVIEKMN